MKNRERIENLEKQVKELYSLLQQEQPIKDKAYYEQFIGRKVRGFEFSHDEICYPSEMKDYEGKLGIILRYAKNVNSYYVKFKDAGYSYPADMVIEKLEPEEETVFFKYFTTDGLLGASNQPKDYEKVIYLGKFQGNDIFAASNDEYNVLIYLGKKGL